MDFREGSDDAICPDCGHLFSDSFGKANCSPHELQAELFIARRQRDNAIAMAVSAKSVATGLLQIVNDYAALANTYSRHADEAIRIAKQAAEGWDAAITKRDVLR